MEIGPSTKLVRGVHVNTSGNMKADFSDGSTGTLAVVAGQTYAYEITKVYQTGPPSPATPSSDMPAQQRQLDRHGVPRDGDDRQGPSSLPQRGGHEVRGRERHQPHRCRST